MPNSQNPYEKTIKNILPNKEASEQPNFLGLINSAAELFQNFYDKIISYSRNLIPEESNELKGEWAAALGVEVFGTDNFSEGIAIQNGPSDVYGVAAIQRIGRIFGKQLTVSWEGVGFIIGVGRAGDAVGLAQSSSAAHITIAGTDSNADLQRALSFYAPAWIVLNFT